MVFSSPLFLFCYLPLMLLLYYVCPKRGRNTLFFVGSLLFYAWGEPVYVLIMVFSTLLDFTCGYMIEKHAENPKKKKAFLLVSMIGNLSILGFFKYYNFAAENILGLFGIEGTGGLDVPLPIGISFYTFQTMSYSIDVYRGDTKAAKNILDFGAYVTMFPQLIAGPIVRYTDVSLELLNKNRENIDLFGAGVRRFCVGLGKKVLLANNIGLLWDTMSGSLGGELSVLGAWLGIIAYSFQIFFDFAGYSDMAIGLGAMFGFKFPENFDYPYISKSITEFWRRWHMTLGSWFREYVYIPLGGNRRGLPIQIRNILIVWFLTGLWHGASWNFVLWGLYFGLILLLEKAFLLKWLKKTPAVVQHLYAIFLVIIGWVIFAFDTMGPLTQYLATMFGLNGAPLITSYTLYLLKSYLPLLVVLCVASTPLLKNLARKPKLEKSWAVAAPVLSMVILFVCTAYLADAGYNPFLYFRF